MAGEEARECGLRPGGVAAAHERDPVAELQGGVGLSLGIVPEQVRSLRMGPRVEPSHGQHPPEVGIGGPRGPGPLEALRRLFELAGVVAGHAQEVLDLREGRVQPGRRLEPLRGALEAPALRVDDTQVDVGAGQGLGHTAPQGLPLLGRQAGNRRGHERGVDGRTRVLGQRRVRGPGGEVAAGALGDDGGEALRLGEMDGRPLGVAGLAQGEAELVMDALDERRLGRALGPLQGPALRLHRIGRTAEREQAPAEVEEGPRGRRGRAGGPLEGGQRLLGPTGQHQRRPQEEVRGRVVRRHQKLLAELRDGVVDPGYPLVDQEDHAQVVVGPAHSRVLRERGPELDPGAVVGPGVPVGAPDQDPRLRDRPRLPDLVEGPLGVLVLPLGQVGGGQGERQLQVVGGRRPGGQKLPRRPLGVTRGEVGLGQEPAKLRVPRVLLHEAGQVKDGRVDPARLQLDDGPCLERAPRFSALRRGAENASRASSRRPSAASIQPRRSHPSRSTEP